MKTKSLPLKKENTKSLPFPKGDLEGFTDNLYGQSNLIIGCSNLCLNLRFLDWLCLKNKLIKGVIYEKTIFGFFNRACLRFIHF